MKTKKELNALNEEVETMNRNLHKPGCNTLTNDSLKKVAGGIRFEVIDEIGYWVCTKCGKKYNLVDGNFAVLHEESCKG